MAETNGQPGGLLERGHRFIEDSIFLADQYPEVNQMRFVGVDGESGNELYEASTVE